MNAVITREQASAVDDMASFGNALTEREVDRAIAAKCRRFDVEIRRGCRVLAVELNVLAETSIDAVLLMQDRWGLNYGFRAVAK